MRGLVYVARGCASSNHVLINHKATASALPGSRTIIPLVSKMFRRIAWVGVSKRFSSTPLQVGHAGILTRVITSDSTGRPSRRRIGLPLIDQGYGPGPAS